MVPLAAIIYFLGILPKVIPSDLVDEGCVPAAHSKCRGVRISSLEWRLRVKALLLGQGTDKQEKKPSLAHLREASNKLTLTAPASLTGASVTELASQTA